MVKGSQIMFLEQKKIKPTGRVYLSIKQGYRDKDGKSKSKTIKALGYLDELSKKMDDPIAHFEAEAKRLELEAKSESSISVTIKSDEHVMPGDTDSRKNYGYIVLSQIYHELELDRFFNNKRRHENFEYNSESIMRLLSYARIIYPESKRQTLQLKDRFFEGFDFSLDDVYDSLEHFGKIAQDAQLHIHEKITAQYGRDASLIYYDVTNYYFETEKQDDTRKDGYSKEHRRDPIIQMGMAIDRNGLPMAYRTYPGNTHDSETYIPSLTQIKKEYNVGRAVVVADKGLNCGDNIVFSSALKDGYIFSQSVTGGCADLKEFVLNEKGYTVPTQDGFKMKSRITPVTVKISNGATKSGKKSRKTITLEAQKQIVFYSPKYAERTRYKRSIALQKAAELVKDPSKYSRATHYGAAAYVNNFEIDKKTGKYTETHKELSINKAKVTEEEKYDGYYVIITSEADTPDKDIIDMYHGLWRIEETFKITKSVLRTRPVFVYKKEHIGGHFLVCFIALMLLRLVEKRLGGEFSAECIADTMREVECSHMGENAYLFSYADNVTEAVREKMGIDLTRKCMTLGEIKQRIGATKKHDSKQS